MFPDYSHDTIWVAALAVGCTRSPAVSWNPGRSHTGGFPVQVNPGNPTALSSPVYDHISGNVFVGDYGGFFYRVSSAGVVTKSAQIDFGAGLVAGPIVDSTAGKVYVFLFQRRQHVLHGTRPCSAVYLFATNFGAGKSGTES